jgi:cellulose synthase/poly-beta-1,6-N-acetylglucosamine synthase-like glycosyltransferase
MLSAKQIRNVLILSSILAIIPTCVVSYTILNESPVLSSISDDTILENHVLLASLQAAQSHGVVIAIHGWKHENFSELNENEKILLLEKSKKIFKQSGFNSNIFVSPYEVSDVPETRSTMDAMRIENISVPFNGANVHEYTWEWRNIASFTDPRYAEAVTQIKEDNPHVLVLHVQDWNPITQKFLSDYLATTSNSNITLRMDDVDVNTKASDINEFTRLCTYKSVKSAVLAVIPAGFYTAGENPVRYGIPVNDLMSLYFLFFILTALLPMSFLTICKLVSERIDGKQKSKLLSLYPDLVTIIVPAYNEEKSIAKCIESLLRQDYAGQKEIIVVNDGSTDRTPQIIPQYPVRLLDLKNNGGKANALNEALKIAKGDIIIFSDGDSNMATDCVRQIVKKILENKDVDMVTGNVVPNMPEKANWFMKLFTYCQMVEYHVEQNVARSIQAMNGGVLVCPGPITAVKKHVCNVVKFSDNTVVEDADFTVDALMQGFKVIRCSEARVYTNAPTTIKSWIKQRDRWWYGNLQVWKQHKKWAIRNPWMDYNYIGFIFSTLTVIMMLAIPILLDQYADPVHIGLTCLLHMIIPIIVYIVFNAIFFWHDKKLIPFIIPYIAVYSLLRITIATKIYLYYITGVGMKIKFGSRTIVAK